MKNYALAFLLLFLLTPALTFAQSDLTIALNENIMGEITLTQASQIYRFSNSQAEIPLLIQVNSLSANFAPVLVLYDAQEQRIARAVNPTGLVQRQLSFTPAANQDYLIQVLGVDGSQGEFVLTIVQQPYSPAPPFIELRPNYDFQDRVTVDEPFKIYQVTASQTEMLTLAITTEGSAAVISDDEGNIFGTVSSNLPHSTFRIPPALNAIYFVTIYHSGIERREPFTIRLMPDATTTE